MTEWLIGIVMALASGAVAFFVGSIKGRKAERKDREIEELNRRIATRQQIDQVLRDNEGATDADIDRRLREIAGRQP